MLNKQREWDPTTSMKMAAYPAAGPTPGTKDFAEYYEQQITANNISYSSRYNSLDVVPHAWEKDTLATIPEIYNANIFRSFSVFR